MPPSTSWSDESVLRLVEGYKARPGLWDPDSPDYKNPAKKTAHWVSLADEMQVDVEDLKKKVNSVTASFRRERARERAEDRGYKSTWFAYGALAFLLEKFKGRDAAAGVGSIPEYVEEVSIENNIEDGFFFNITESSYDEQLEGNSSHSTSREPVRVLATTTSGQHMATSGSDAHKRPSRAQAGRSSSKTMKTEPAADVDGRTRLPEPISSPPGRSSVDIFGELVAAKLREYPDYIRIVTQQKINNVLFDADMGHYNEPEGDPLTL